MDLEDEHVAFYQKELKGGESRIFPKIKKIIF
jgi:hypothetical protein